MFKLVTTTFATIIFSIFMTSTSFAADEPSMHEVYLAAEAGKFAEAQAMMNKVLADHPNSAKAHFVEAELKAKQGLLSEAKTELSTAESLEPGLGFVKPATLLHLKEQLSLPTTGIVQRSPAEQSIPSAAKEWLPAVGLFIGLLVIVLIISSLMKRRQPNLPVNYGGNTPRPNPGPYGNNPAGNYPGGNYPGGGYPNQPMGGQSSGLMGSLATGAALGAGVAAGGALAHHFLDGDGHPAQHADNFANAPVDNSSWGDNNNASYNNDLGGDDFGIADNSSWDDDSFGGDGGDDWT